MKPRSFYVPQSLVDSLGALTKRVLPPWFWYGSAVLVLNSCRFQVCAREGIERKVTKARGLLLKLVMHGEDRADKILDWSLTVATESFHYPSSGCIIRIQ